MNPKREQLDPKLHALLDQALAPPPAPPDLVERILAATRQDLDRLTPPGVIARIGVTRLRRIAAAVIFAMEVGIWATIIGIAQDARALASINQDLQRLNRLSAVVPATPLDDQLRLLSAQIDSTRYAGDWDSQDHRLDMSLSEWELRLSDDPNTLTF